MYRDNENPKAIYLKDYKKPDFSVESLFLNFEIFNGHTIATSKTTYVRSGAKDAQLHLDGENMELLSLKVDGVDTDPVSHDKHGLTLDLSGKDTALVEIKTKIKPEENTLLEGLYMSDGMYCTQCESEGFRHITYFQDRPDIMTEYTVRIEADKTKNPVLLSNGNLTEEGDLDDNRHFAIWHDPHKKPSYLFALVAGDLAHISDTFITMSGTKVDLKIYVEHGDEDQCVFAMDCLKKAMKWDEEAYGREYDLNVFNVVAVHAFNFGAMENKSLNIFNAALLLATPDLATDVDFYHIDAVVAHEYFHNWSGNRVTCRDWFQLSLKEGFTVFREQSYCADQYSPAVQRIDDVTNLRQRQFPEDSGPMAHPIRPDSYIEINNFYTMTVYEKGSEVIRMISLILGEENFRKGSDLYFDRHDGEAATCDDFVKAMEDASGVDLSQFKLWYSQAGTPTIEAHGSHDASSSTYRLKLSQSIPDTPGQTNKKPMHMPVSFGLLGQDGDDLIGTQILHLTESEQIFEFKDIPEGATPSILRGFSSPVKLKTNLSNDDLKFLIVHDSDGFNQWESGKQFALNVMMPMIDAREKGEDISTPSELIGVISDLLDTYDPKETDKALLARALSLPGFDYIAELRETVDPLAIYDVIKQVSHDIADQLGDKLLALYNSLNDGEAFKPDHLGMSKRSLRNILLSYLMSHTEAPKIDLAKAQYDKADNMNDRMIALRLLCQHDCPEQHEALEDYYNRYKGKELAINKWFSAQTSAPGIAAVSKTKSLMEHADFNIKKPNSVRAVLGGLSVSNPSGFHVKDGSGYDLIADVIIDLNAKNPKLAAGLTRPLRGWKRYTPEIQVNMKRALTKIINTQNLSKDIYEVVSKSLDA